MDLPDPSLATPPARTASLERRPPPLPAGALAVGVGVHALATPRVRGKLRTRAAGLTPPRPPTGARGGPGRVVGRELTHGMGGRRTVTRDMVRE